MTWFISTSDIIGAFVFVILAWVLASLFTAIRVVEWIGPKARSWQLWGAVAASGVIYAAPIVYIGWRIWG